MNAPFLKHRLVPPFRARAVNFEGTNNYLTRGADLTGNADGKTGIISLWFKPGGAVASRNFIASDGSPQFQLRYSSGNALFLQGLTSGGTTILSVVSTGTYTSTSRWYHFLCAWNLAAAVALMYVDDVDVSSTVTALDFNIDYTRTNWAVGAATGGTGKLIGDVSELYFAPSQFLDISNAAIRRRFRDRFGKPVFLGADGSLPTGQKPAIYLSGAVDAWEVNRGVGGGFTENGTLTASLTSPSD